MDVVEVAVAPPGRRAGPDVVRAIAMLGVVTMNYHGYLVLRGARRDGGAWYRLFDPWTGPVSTRFAATFVVTAGVGVTLLTRHTAADPARRAAMSWRLVRRGLLLYAVGMVFDFVWDGTILPYYGAMFVCAAGLFRLHTWMIAGVGGTAAVSGWLIHWTVVNRAHEGIATDWLTEPGPRSPTGLVINVFANGTHPLLPWLAFLCAGIVLGRYLDRPRWPVVVGSTGFAMALSAAIASRVANRAGSGEIASIVWSSHPFDRGIVYTVSALGTALVAFATISTLADTAPTHPVIDGLRRAGQLSLTIYVTHALVFNLLVDWLGWVTPSGLGTALVAALTVWAAATTAAIAYQRRFGRGPVERLYRALT